MSDYIRDDVDQFFEFDLHIPSRTIHMAGECDERQADFFVKAMALLQAKNNRAAITILMNNPGGDEYHGLASYDAIACSPCHVTVIAFGHVMSMGSWIFQAADERIMAPRATMMIHYGTWASDDHVKYFRVHAAEGERLNTLMENDYLRRIREMDPKYPARKIKKLLEDETYLTPQDAIELGLADKILNGEEGE